MKSVLLASKQFMFLFTLSQVLEHEVFIQKGLCHVRVKPLFFDCETRIAILHNTRGLYICSSDQTTNSESTNPKFLHIFSYQYLSHDLHHNSKLGLPKKRKNKISLLIFEYSIMDIMKFWIMQKQIWRILCFSVLGSSICKLLNLIQTIVQSWRKVWKSGRQSVLI